MKRLPYTLVVLVAFGAACSSSDDAKSRTPSESPFANYPSGAPSTMSPGATTPGQGANATPGANPATSGTGTVAGEMGNGTLPLGMMPAPTGNEPGLDANATQTSLPRSTPEAQGIASADVLKLVNALDTAVHEIHSFMLLRHGQVVAEGFWSPYTVDDIQVLYSGTKSFNSTAVGMLVDDGKLSVDDLVLSKFPELAPAQPDANMQKMTIKNLLTMATGHTTDTIDTLRNAPNGEWTKAFLATTVPNAPGTNFLYNSGAAYVLGAIVQKTSGQTVDEFLTSRLFEPLGIQRHLWGKSPEGVNLTDGGLSVRTEDFAKFGLLYLQHGSWNGQQLVSEQWVTDATSKEISNGNNDSNWGYGYGYQFWRSPKGFRADGSLGQYSFVLPDEDIVIAITSGTSNSGGTDTLMKTVFANVPAVQPAALAEDAGSLQALNDKLAALSLALPTGADSSAMAAQVSGAHYTVASNSQGITGLSFDFNAAPPIVTIEDGDGPHAIPVGIGSWLRERTGFKKHINELFDTPDQGVAARGAWSADDTFNARMVFTETPYTAITNFKFYGSQVTLDVSYNVRWGSMTEPQVVGTR
jgi:CubicO group peptidase (beta-lactamase class C family)